MPRHPYPPHDFVCLYERNCPYLSGLSTTWVLGEYRRADDVYHEHLRIIDNFSASLKASEEQVRLLERENAEQKAKLKAMHERQFKPNKKKGEGSSGELAGSASLLAGNKKRGAPMGHQGWFRPKPTKIDRTVSVSAPKRCPHCSSKDLRPIDERMEHIQEDIVIAPRPVVTQYVHEQAFCTRCRRPVVQAAPDEILNAPIGPVAKATAMYLRYAVCIPYRKVTEILRVLFG